MADRRQAASEEAARRRPLPSPRAKSCLHRRASRQAGKARHRPGLRHCRAATASGSRQLLRDLPMSGLRRRTATAEPPGRPAAVAVLDDLGRDADGELLAEPAEWPRGRRPAAESHRRADARRGRAAAARHRRPRCSPSDARPTDDGRLHGARHQDLASGKPATVLGVFRIATGRRPHRAGRPQAEGAGRRRDGLGEAKDGDLVAVEVARAGRYGLPRARVIEVLGSMTSEKAVSLIAIHAHGIPDVFPAEVLAEAADARAGAAWPSREDWRDAAARHHRSGRRQGPRRRGPRRARPRPGEPRRLHRHRRHRRRRRLCAPGLGARPRGAEARQLGLFPRPRRADAARAHLQRSLLAARRRGPPCACRPHGLRRRRPQDAATASTAS